MTRFLSFVAPHRHRAAAWHLGMAILTLSTIAIAAGGNFAGAQEKKAVGILDILKLKKKEKAADSKAEKKDEGTKEEEEAADSKGEKKADSKETKKAETTEQASDTKKASGAKKAASKKTAEEAVKELPAGAREKIMKLLQIGGATGVATESIATDGTKPAEDAAESGDGDESESAPKPAKKKEPIPPMFWMRDGTRLAGFPDLAELHVETAYGPLVIPISEVEHVRFARAKKNEFGEELKSLVEQLGHEEFDLREEAMEKIRKIGAPAVVHLQKALKTDDEEIKNRLEKLIEDLAEEEDEPEDEQVYTIPLKGDEDEISTRQFTVKGRVREEIFKVDTRYGKLDFSREDIVSILFQEPLIRKLAFSVQGSQIAGQKRWLDTGIEFTKGKAYELAASGNITLPNYNQSCGPEGTTNVPARYEKFPAGALVGKIGAKGKAFLVGSSYSGKADTKGKLFLAIAMKSNNAQGSLEVELKMKNE